MNDLNPIAEVKQRRQQHLTKYKRRDYHYMVVIWPHVVVEIIGAVRAQHSLLLVL